MFAVNPAPWGAVKQAPSNFKGCATTLDPGAEIFLTNLAQHKWKTKVPKFADESTPRPPPGVHPTADINKSIAEDDIYTAIRDRPQVLNGDMIDVTTAIAARNQTLRDAELAELGRDRVVETLSAQNVERKEATYRARYAHMIREGFSEAEAGAALADMRRDHAKYVARNHHVTPETVNDIVDRVIGRKV
jgi:hypothetical protein